MTDDGFRFCRLDRAGHVLTITIDRPEALNALHLDAHVELSRAFDLYAADPELRVAVITGAGDRAFCVGTDLKSLAQTGSYAYPYGGFAGITKRFDLFKPVIAAVNGLAVGGGFELALACDLIVAADGARMGLTEVALGLIADSGGVIRLPRRIPYAVAAEMLLTGRLITADEAARWGLVNQVVSAEALLETAVGLAERIVQMAPLSVAAVKQTLRGLHDDWASDFATLRSGAFPAYQALVDSDDAREGAAAFAEGRPPQWSGR